MPGSDVDNGPTEDIGAVARRAAAAARANHAIRSAAERADAVRAATTDARVGGTEAERSPGVLIGLGLGAAAVAIVVARTVFRRR